MNFPFYTAKRYLFSKNNRNAVNVISGISVVVVAVATAALVIVLSSINGFGSLIDSQISEYAPDLKIEPAKGKTFDTKNKIFEKIKKLPEIKYFAEIIEENALIKYAEKQTLCTVKGIPDDYDNFFNLKFALRDGIFKTSGKNLDYAVVGGGIAYKLGLSAETQKTLSLWIPNRKKVSITNPESSFKRTNLIPSGIISIDNDFDLKYILTSVNTLKKITDRNIKEASYIEILVNDDKNTENIKQKIRSLLGDNYLVKNKYEQFEVYKVMKSERLAAFIIMMFITLTASLSIIGSVTMLIIEKKKDLFTLASMGAEIKTIRKIFFLEGWLISFTGAVSGIILGAAVCLLQQKFGLVKFPSEGAYIVDAYPVVMKISDFILTFFSVMTIGTILSFLPAQKIKPEYLNKKQSE